MGRVGFRWLEPRLVGRFYSGTNYDSGGAAHRALRYWYRIAVLVQVQLKQVSLLINPHAKTPGLKAARHKNLENLVCIYSVEPQVLARNSDCGFRQSNRYKHMFSEELTRASAHHQRKKKSAFIRVLF